MRKITSIALLLLCTIGTLRAQNEVQALRVSWQNPFGTARYNAQGGAIGALGGDLSASQTNPAGLAFYRKSEFSVSPSFYWVNNESSFLNSPIEDSRLRFTLGSMGYINAHSSKKKSGFVGGAFGFTYNTLVNFNNRSTMGGQNMHSSLLDDFTYHANQQAQDLDPFYEQVAVDAGLLPYDSISGEYWNDFQDGGYGQQQSRVVDQRGYIGEYAFSGAFNFSNFLYAGATFGIHSVRFYEDIYHLENDAFNDLPYIDRFDFREYNTTRGWGYTFRFGMIIRPFQLLRVGASFQIPTYYYLSEEKYTDAQSWWDSDTGWDSELGVSPRGYYDYKIKAPMRAHAHASVILFKFATLSAAYEWVDYSAARLDSHGDKFFDANESIRYMYTDGHNLKAGAEIRVQSVYFRGGWQYLSSPYTDERNDASMMVYSGGLGVRSRNMVFDVSYSRGRQTQVYGLYNPMNGAPESSYTSLNQVNPNNMMITLGLRF